jgi:hypothetical protein
MPADWAPPGAMSESILFDAAAELGAGDTSAAPEYFRDLNCDQVVDAIVAGKQEYDLPPFFYASLGSVDAVAYRHEVFQDLEDAALFDRVNAFAGKMHDVRQRLTSLAKLLYPEQKQSWFLEAVGSYRDAILSFSKDLDKAELKSRALCSFRAYLSTYIKSARFRSLVSEAEAISCALSRVKYCVLIKGSSFTVRRYDSEPDYSVQVEKIFEKFKQGASRDYRVEFRERDDLNHVEAKILEFVGRLHPDVFSALANYVSKYQNFLDSRVATFDREIQFYVAYLDYISPLRKAGLPFCYPAVSAHSKEVYDYDGFDIALAHKLVKDGATVVRNDFHLRGKERVLVVSGPNQGGKTTFARMFGQLHYLASIGCPVPGRRAQLYLFDRLFTHFEKEEAVETLRGKLEDDLVRIRRILDQATPRSILIMNEIFTSTTLEDEIFLSRKVMKRIADLDLLSVWVTFVDELASNGPQTVSMVSTIVPDNPALRTFKIVRRPADGLAYALAIAQKYRLTYESIKERIRS